MSLCDDCGYKKESIANELDFAKFDFNDFKVEDFVKHYDHDECKCKKDFDDHSDPNEKELITLAKFIEKLRLPVRLTLDAESEVLPFPPHPGQKIDDIEDGFFRFNNVYIPISRVDVINLDFGIFKDFRNCIYEALSYILGLIHFDCDYDVANSNVEDLRKLLLKKSREHKEIKTIHSVRKDMLDGSLKKDIGTVGQTLVLIPYEYRPTPSVKHYLLAVLVLKNIRLIEFVQ